MTDDSSPRAEGTPRADDSTSRADASTPRENGTRRADSRARFDSRDLRRFLFEVLLHFRLPAADAAIGADALIDADLSGVETHGLGNFPSHWHYAPGLRDGTISPVTRISVLRDSPVAASWDAGRGFGPVVAHRAMSAAMAKAAGTGVGMITVRDGCHFGAAGYLARMAAGRDMIGMVMCHTAPSAVAPGGRDKVFGTNPLAVAAPVGGGPPFVLDMATTAAAGTKVVVARRRGEPIPTGWLLDAAGRATTDPAAQADGGALLPLGSGPGDAGHKGFGLGLVVDILSGVLSGTGSGLFTTFGPGWRQGYWLAAWRIDAFVDPVDFKSDMRAMVEGIHATRPAPGHTGVVVPGERAAASRLERSRTGIPLDPAVVGECAALASETGVAFPDPIGPGTDGFR